MLKAAGTRNQVISRCQAPTTFAVHQKTEVLRVIVSIVNNEIEVGALEHLLQITGT